jgi:hypothetical protein
MFLVGGKSWAEHNPKIRDLLIAAQDDGKKAGAANLKGSWSPAGDQFSVNSRLLSTSFALITLEVYYRLDLLLERRAPAGSGPKEMERWWTDLPSDMLKARQSTWALVRLPRETIPFLNEKLRPAKLPTKPDMERFERLIRDLDSDDFQVREKATQELEKAIENAEPSLRLALEGKPSLDVQRRIERLLDKQGATVTEERTRTVRALEVLEEMNTPEARKLIEGLAKGAPGAWLTQEAKASLERLAKR